MFKNKALAIVFLGALWSCSDIISQEHSGEDIRAYVSKGELLTEKAMEAQEHIEQVSELFDTLKVSTSDDENSLKVSEMLFNQGIDLLNSSLDFVDGIAQSYWQGVKEAIIFNQNQLLFQEIARKMDGFMRDLKMGQETSFSQEVCDLFDAVTTGWQELIERWNKVYHTDYESASYED